tara:strand:+ start:6133 stop:6336 length:204 start_codon:yes stop_codon:yes gene_type:complete
MNFTEKSLEIDIRDAITANDGRVRVSELNMMLGVDGWNLGSDKDFALLCKGLDFTVRVVESTLYVSL